MFNIKLEEKSYKMSFKALPVQRRSTMHPGVDRVKKSRMNLRKINL